jgi:hypothetical protein
MGLGWRLPDQRREGSRPRDPLSPKPTAFPDQEREYTFGFENVVAAHEDVRPPQSRPRNLSRRRPCEGGSEAPSTNPPITNHLSLAPVNVESMLETWRRDTRVASIQTQKMAYWPGSLDSQTPERYDDWRISEHGSFFVFRVDATPCLLSLSRFGYDAPA